MKVLDLFVFPSDVILLLKLSSYEMKICRGSFLSQKYKTRVFYNLFKRLRIISFTELVG